MVVEMAVEMVIEMAGEMVIGIAGGSVATGIDIWSVNTGAIASVETGAGDGSVETGTGDVGEDKNRPMNEGR
jgi:hypothetical protein